MLSFGHRKKHSAFSSFTAFADLPNCLTKETWLAASCLENVFRKYIWKIRFLRGVSFLIPESMVDYKKRKQFSYVRGIAIAERRLFMQQNNMTNQTTAATSEEDFIMKPYIDWCFKELMRNPNTRRGFIAELLKLSPDQIGNTTILENELSKRSEEEKKGVLDVHVLLENGTQLDIEMQVVYMHYWDDRSLFYLCKMFSSQLHKGEDYDQLQKCVHVGVLNFTYYKNDDICYRKARIYDEETGSLYSDKLEIQVLELPKIPKEYHHPDGIIAWMKFFRGGKKEDLKEMSKGNSYLEEAYEDLMEMSQDEEKRRAYEARERAIRDQLSLQRQAERTFQQLTDAQEKLEEAARKIVEAERKVVEAEQKAAVAEQKAVEAEQKAAVAEQKTAVAEQKTAEAEQKTAEAERKTVEAEQKTIEAEQKTIEAEQRSEKTQGKLSEAQRLLETVRAQKDAAHEQGRKDAVMELYQEGVLNLEQAASACGMSPDDFQKQFV